MAFIICGKRVKPIRITRAQMCGAVLTIALGYSPPCNAQFVECKSSAPGNVKVFDLTIDRQMRRILECFGSKDSITTREFSDNLISAECPIVAGKRSFKIDRYEGTFSATEEYYSPPTVKTLSGECQIVNAA